MREHFDCGAAVRRGDAGRQARLGPAWGFAAGIPGWAGGDVRAAWSWRPRGGGSGRRRWRRAAAGRCPPRHPDRRPEWRDRPRPGEPGAPPPDAHAHVVGAGRAVRSWRRSSRRQQIGFVAAGRTSACVGAPLGAGSHAHMVGTRAAGRGSGARVSPDFGPRTSDCDPWAKRRKRSAKGGPRFARAKREATK